MSSFIGHFHPVFVHLPIGILVLAFILQLIARKQRSSGLDQAIGISLLAGSIAAIVSCITGFYLSRNDDYDAQLVSQHQWLGIGVAVVTAVLYGLHRQRKAVRWQWPLMIGLFVLVSITGHLGGSLTHGSDYLTAPLATMMSGDTVAAEHRAVIANVQEALAYKDVVQPILQSKCYGCHNKNKQKGGLRMDDQELLLKGGKNGVVLVPGNATESDLLKRLALPREDDDHMPPKEKPQLTDKEVALLHWWVTTGASFDKKVNQLDQPDAIMPVLTALQEAPEEKTRYTDIPAEPVEAANAVALQKVRALGAVILPVAKNSNYLSANFITATIKNEDLKLLAPLKQQLIWLKLGNTLITDSALSYVAQCNRITRLQLEHTAITDAGIKEVAALKHLEHLNIVDTKVTAAGLLQLARLDKLQAVYCYQSRVRAEDWAALKKAFPKVNIDSGGYTVPLLVTDTTLVKPPELKKK